MGQEAAVGREQARRRDAARDACGALLDATEAARVSVWVINDRAGTVSPFVAVGQLVPAEDVARRWTRLPLRDAGPVVTVLESRQPASISELSADSAIAADLVELGVSSLWMAPLEVAGRPVGIVVIEPAPAGREPVIGSQLRDLALIVAEARAWREGLRRQAEADLLLELAEISSSSARPADHLEDLCDRLVSRLEVPTVCLYLMEDGVPVLRAVSSAGASHSNSRTTRLDAGTQVPPLVTAALAEQPRTVVDLGLAGVPPADRRAVGSPSGLAVAIGPAGAPSGVLVLHDPRPRRFTDPFEVRVVEAAAAQIAAACERANLVADRDHGLRAATAVRELLREGSRAASVMEAGAVIARVGRSALECDHACAIFVDDVGRISDVVGVNIGQAWLERLQRWTLARHASEVPLGAMLFGTTEPITVLDASTTDLLPHEMVENLALRSFVAMPLWSSSRFHGGVVYSRTMQRRPWSSEDRHLVEQLALESALVIENARLRATERAHAEELAQLALHDALTGLPNRALLADRLDAALRHTARTRAEVAVLFVDLTSFKAINDRYGHATGDAVLVEVAARLNATIRSGDTVARLAGDEFVLVLWDVSVEAAAAAAARVCEAVAVRGCIDGHLLHIGCSVGVALGSFGRVTSSELLRRADAAMYRAKRDATVGYALYDAALDAI